MGKTLLVTGGAGFIGSHVVDALLRRGDRVVCLDDFNGYYDPTLKRGNVAAHLTHPGYTLIEGDIRDRRLLQQLHEHFPFDVVVHLAAVAGVRPSFVDPFEYQSINLEGTLSMLEAARKAGVTSFVNASSSSVYGENRKTPFEETDALLRPASPYGATKLGAEALTRVYAHAYDMRAVSLRFFTVYGPRQRPDMAITKFMSRILSRQPITIYGDGSSRRDFTYVGDIVRGVLAACDYEASQYEVFNLGSGRTVTLLQLIEQIEDALGIIALKRHAPCQTGDVPVTCSNIEKAQELLGYAPSTQLDRGLPLVAQFLARGGRSHLDASLRLSSPADAPRHEPAASATTTTGIWS